MGVPWSGCRQDGTPNRPTHPWNDGGLFIPRALAKPSIPVHLVCGPPGGGKSTYVQSCAQAHDTVIDLDVIKAQLSGMPVHGAGEEWLMPALAERNRKLAALSVERTREAWLIVGAPDVDERKEWRRLLGVGNTIVVIAPEHECVRRCDPRPPGVDWGEAVRRWFVVSNSRRNRGRAFGKVVNTSAGAARVAHSSWSGIQ